MDTYHRAQKRDQRRKVRYENWTKSKLLDEFRKRVEEDPELKTPTHSGEDALRRQLMYHDAKRRREAKKKILAARAKGEEVPRYRLQSVEGAEIVDEYLTDPDESVEEPPSPRPLAIVEEKTYSDMEELPHTWEAFETSAHGLRAPTLYALPQGNRPQVSCMLRMLFSLPRLMKWLLGIPQKDLFSSSIAKLQKLAFDLLDFNMEVLDANHPNFPQLRKSLGTFVRELSDTSKLIDGTSLDGKSLFEIWRVLCHSLILEILKEPELQHIRWSMQQLFGFITYQRTLECYTCHSEWPTKISQYGLDLQLFPTPDEIRTPENPREQRVSLGDFIDYWLKSPNLTKCRKPACAELTRVAEQSREPDFVLVFPEVLPICLKGWRDYHRQQNPRPPHIEIPYLIDLSGVADESRRSIDDVFYRLTAILAERKVPQTTQPEEQYEWICYTDIERERPGQTRFRGDFHSTGGVVQHRQDLDNEDCALFHKLTITYSPHMLLYVRCNKDETPYEDVVVHQKQIQPAKPDKSDKHPGNTHGKDFAGQTGSAAGPSLGQQRGAPQNAAKNPRDAPGPTRQRDAAPTKKQRGGQSRSIICNFARRRGSHHESEQESDHENAHDEDHVSQNPSDEDPDSDAEPLLREPLTQRDACDYLKAEVGWLELPRDTRQQRVPRRRGMTNDRVLLRTPRVAARRAAPAAGGAPNSASSFDLARVSSRTRALARRRGVDPTILAVVLPRLRPLRNVVNYRDLALGRNVPRYRE